MQKKKAVPVVKYLKLYAVVYALFDVIIKVVQAVNKNVIQFW